MTTIAACIRDRMAVIGCDRMTSDGASTVPGQPKIVRGDVAAVGLAGRMVYMRWLEANPPPDDPDLLDNWVDDLIEWSDDRGIGDDHGIEGELLVLYPDAIYHIGSDGCIVRVARNFHAIGSGGPEARAVMMAEQGRFEPHDACRTVYDALKIASQLDPMTGCGFFVIELEPELSDGPDDVDG